MKGRPRRREEPPPAPARSRHPAPRRPSRLPLPEPLPGKSRDLVASVGFALEGVVYAVRHERNVKIHFVAGVAVLIACLVLPLEPLGVLLALGATCLVLVAELMNTAIEAVVNMTISGHHPLAKIAKDVAAAAVLVAAFFSLAVAWLVLLPAVASLVWAPEGSLLERVARDPWAWVRLLASLAGVVSVVWCAVAQQGPFTPSGLILGHAAMGFGVSAALVTVTRAPAAALLALPFAMLVARHRLRSGLHRWPSVLGGAAVGLLLTVSLFLCAQEVVP